MTRPSLRRRNFKIRLEELEDREVPAAVGAAYQFGALGSNTESHAVATDAAGNVYTTGIFTGGPDFDPGPGAFHLFSGFSIYNTYITKMDKTGAFQWAVEIDAEGGSNANAVAADGQGNVYVTGSFMQAADFDPGPGTFNLTSAGQRDAFVIKLNSAGNLVWVRQFGGEGSDEGWGVTADRHGNVYSTGNFRYTVDFDPGPGTTNLTSAGDVPVTYVSKLDASGGFVWAGQLGNGTSVGVSGLALDAQENVHVTGGFYGTADFDPGAGVFNLTSAGNSDAYVWKLNKSGGFVWARQIGSGSGLQASSGVAVDGGGNVYTTGYFTGTTDFDPGAGAFNLDSSETDAFVSKLDRDGQFVWARKLGGTERVDGYGVAMDAQGSVYVTGTFTGTADFDPGGDAFNLTSAGSNDNFVIKLDSDGDLRWAGQFGGALNDRSYGLAVDRRGNIFTTGFFLGTADFDPGAGTLNLTSAGGEDAFVNKLTQANIGGLAWDDDDSDGVRDVGEPLMAGVVVELFDNTGVSFGVQVTDADGEYSFVDPPASAGGYAVQFRAPGGFVFTGRDLGGDDSRDSDVYPSGYTPDFTLVGDVRVVRDAGLTGATPAFGFVKQAGGSGSEEGRAVTTDAAGNVYVTGNFSGTANFDLGSGYYPLTSVGFLDSFVAKYTSGGALIWARRMGGSLDDAGLGVAVDAAGNVYATGAFRGTDFNPGSGSLHSAGGSDAFVCKLDAFGNLIWARQLGGNSDDGANGVAVDGQGNVFTTGNFSGTADLDPATGSVLALTSAGGADAYVSKLDPAGNFVWARRLGGISGDDSRGVAVDGLGNAYATGYFEGTATFGPGGGSGVIVSAGSADAFVTKLDAAGAFQWAKQLGGAPGNHGGDSGTAVVADLQGNVYTTGYFQDTADFDPGADVFDLTSAGVTDAYVSKLDTSGNFVWAGRLGGASNDVSYGIALDSLGHVFTTGIYLAITDMDPGPGVSMLPNIGSYDIFVNELDSSGQFVLARRLGGGGQDTANGVAVNSSGSIFTAGSFRGATDFDPSAADATLASVSVDGSDDAFLSKLVQSTVSGVVWEDRDSDGIRDVGEPLVAGAVAELFGSNGVSLGVQVTGADGAYSFIAPPDITGGYSVQFRPPAGFGFTLQDQGADDTRDSDANATGRTAVFPLPGNQNVVKDAGLTGAAPAFGFVAPVTGTGPDANLDVFKDAVGNVYVSGYFGQTADLDPSAATYPLTSNGNLDAYVAKYTAAGALVWARPSGGPDYDEEYSVAVAADGSVYTTGIFEGTVDFDPGVGTADLTSQGTFDMFVRKLDADGDFVWVRRIGGNAEDVGQGLAVTPAGDVYVSGRFTNTATFGGSALTLTSAGDRDAMVAKLDANGNFLWAKRIGGSGQEDADEVVTDVSGNIYVSGAFHGTVDFDPSGSTEELTSAGGADAFLWKLDANGNYGWAKRLGAGSDDYAHSVVVDTHGYVYAVGEFVGTATITPNGGAPTVTSNGLDDIFVSKFAAEDGGLLWAKNLGGTGRDGGAGVAVDSRGHVYATGGFRETADFDPSAGSYPLTSPVNGSSGAAFVAELDADGAIVRARAFGGSGADNGTGMTVDDNGHVYAVGDFETTVDFDPSAGETLLTSGGFDDAYLSMLVFASVTGAVFDDLNGDGTRDGGEPGLPGAVVELVNAVDGIIGNANDVVLETRVTGADGSYRFDDPALGTNRYLRITPPLGTAGNRVIYREITTPSRDSEVDAAGRSSLFSLRDDPIQSFNAGVRNVSDTAPGWVIGSAGTDTAKGVTTDADGNTFVVGSFAGTADFDPGPGVAELTGSGAEGFVAKYDPAGGLIWARAMGGAGADETAGVAVDTNGNVYVTGFHTGAASFGGLPASGVGGTDVFVSKLAPNGSFLWVKSYGGTDDDTGVGVAVDDTGSVHVSGMFRESATFGGTTFVTDGDTDVFLIKLDPNGTLAAAPLQFGGGNNAEQVRVAGIAVGPGGVFLAGTFTGTVDFNPLPGPGEVLTLTRNGSDDAFVVRIRPDGNFGWAHQFGGSAADDTARGITLDSDGNVLFTGGFRGTADFDPGGDPHTLTAVGSSADAYVCKLDVQGNYVWAKQIGGGGADSGAGIVTDSRGYVYVTGDFAGAITTDLGAAGDLGVNGEGGRTVFLVKLDADGQFVLAGQVGGTGTDTAGGVAVSGEGDVRAVGSFTGRSDLDPALGSYPVAATGAESDIFVVQFPEFVIKGRVWEDLNGNGIQDNGEPELTDATVELIETNDGIVGNVNDFVVRTVTTTDGGYEFIDPPDSFGGYAVRVTRPVAVSGNSLPVYVVSPPGQGTNPAIDSDLNAAGYSPVVRRIQGAVANFGGGFREKPLELGGWGVGGTASDKGRAITRDAAGNTYVTGTFEGTVDFDPRSSVASRTSAGLSDGFVAKHDPTGRLLWVRRFGGTALDEPAAITLDPSGNVLVTGTFEKTATFEGTTTTLAAHAAAGQTTNVRDVFVLQLAADGTFKWARRLGGNKLEAVTGIATDKDGNVFTAGTFEGTADFDPAENKVFNLANAATNPPANTVSRDIFLSKLNKDGNFVWAKKIGNIGDDTVTGIALDAAGNVYAAGRHTGTVDFNPGTPVNTLTGDGDFVLCFDNAGNYRWAVTFGNTAVSGLTVSGGFLYTAGAMLRRLDLDGNRVWERTLNGDHLAVAADAVGNVYTTGRFTGLVDFNLGPGSEVFPLTAAGTDAFVTKTDSSGAFVYAHSLGGTAADEGRGLTVAAGGTVFVTGSFQASPDFDISDETRTITGAGNGDVFVWKIPGGGIQGQIWNDLDGDGLRDPNEPAVGGAVINLYKAAAGAGPDTLLGTQISEADGGYRFDAPAPGTGYYTRVRRPNIDGLFFTPADQGGNDDLDSDVNSEGVSPVFAADPAIPTTLDAGLTGTIPPFGIGWTTEGPGDSTAFASAVDAAGNIYVTGEFKGAVDFDPGDGSGLLNVQGNKNHAFVAKYTSAGIFLWAKELFNAADTGGQGIAVDAAGFVYVTGRTPGAPPSDGFDVFVAKLDPAGESVWDRRFGGVGDDYGNAIAVDPAGRVIVTGSFQGTVDFDPGTGVTSLASFGTQDAFVTVLTGDGAFVWARGVGGSGGDDSGRGVATDAAGAVYVAGSFSGTADFDPGAAVLDQTSHGLRDAFVWKLDSTGNIGTTGWAAQAGGPSNDDANAVAVGPAGNVVAAGSFTGTADFDRGPGLLEVLSNGATDAFVWQLSAAGVPVWAKGLGGTTSDAAAAVAANDTGVYVAGAFASFGTPADFDPGAGRLSLHSEANSADAFVAKLDPGGNRQWAHRLGGQNNDMGRGIAVDPAGQVVFAGGLEGQGTYDPGDGDQGLAGGGSANFFFARVSQTLLGGAFPLDSFEPNNTGDADENEAFATDLGVVNVRAEIDGPSLSSVSDEDWFRFELLSSAAPDDFVRVDIEPGHGEAEVELYRLGEGIVLGSATAGPSSGHAGVISLAGREPGLYLVRVRGDASPAFKLTLEVPKGFAKDAREPNNTSVTPANLGILTAPLSLPGLSINFLGDADWFAFNLADEGVASSEARIDFRNALGDLDLDLFDTNGNPLRASAGLDDSESVSLAGLPAGSYLLRVTGHEDALNPAYALTVRPPKPLRSDVNEPNNLPAAATSLGALNGLNSWSDLSVHTTADADWFKFTLTAPGQAGHLAGIDFVHAEGDLDLRLYEEANPATPVAASTGNADSEQISLQGRPAGTYFLKVSGFAGATQSAYSLRTVTPTGTTLPDRLEGTTGNQTKAKASVVQTPGKTKLEGSQTLVDLTLTPGVPKSDEDWFKFTTSGKGTVQHNVVMTYPAANGTLGLELYNSGGAKIVTGAGANGSLVASMKGLAAGTYYARTFIPKGASVGSGYSLTFDAPGSSATDDWTVMVYMTADTLTERAFNDINEMETAVAGLPGSVNLAVMWDQSASRTTYPTGNGTQKAWGTTGMALVSPDTNPNQIATKFEILPEKNTGDPATLKAFVEWAKKNAPASKYAIVFWDHGDGLRGFNFDSQDGQPSGYLTTGDVVTALAGQPKLDLIAFDACFMGVTETAYNLRDTANVVVASQDAIPGDGFEYDLALSALQTNPGTVTAEALATGLVQSFGARYGSAGRADTLSAVRTSALSELATALEAFSTAVRAPSVTDDDKRKLVSAAAGSLLPSRSADTQRDLGSFLEIVAADGTLLPGIQAAALTAFDKLKRAVISRASDLRGHSGLSVYLPVVNLDLQTIDPLRFSDYATEYATFTTTAGWSAMLTVLREGTDERPTDGDIDDKGDADNGSFASATDLQLLGSAGITKTALSLHLENDEDWYKFQVSESGSTLEADITIGGSGGVIFAELRSAGNVLLAQAEGNRVRLENAPAGTYYLHFSANAIVDNYAFTINPPAAPSDRSGSNTTPDKAFDLPSQLGETYAGYAVNAAGQDWLRFSTTPLPQPDLRRVTLTVSGGQSLRAQLRSPTGYVVSSAEGSGTLVLPYTASGAAETYTLVISNLNAVQVFYSLRLDSATATAAHPLDRFDRGNGEFTTANQSDWTVTGTMRLEGGRVQITGGTGQALRKSDAELGDTGVQAKFKLGSGTAKQVVTVLARANLTGDKLNAYEARLEVFKGVATAIIYRTVNGLPSKLALGAGPKLAAGAEGVLRLEAQGQFLRLLVNGVQCVEFTDSFVMPPGLTGFAGTKDVLFDDFQANAITTAAPVGFSALTTGLGGEWQALTGTFTAQQGSFVSGNTTATALYNPARLADLLVSAGYAVPGVNQSVAVIARHNGAAKGSYYEAKVTRKTTGVVATLTRFVNGAAKVLQAVSVGVLESGTVGLEVRGNELRLVLGGVGQPTPAVVIDKSVLLPGRAGLSASGSMSVENFTVTPIAPRFADNFNRADNTSLGSGWDEQPGGNLRIAGNRLTADLGADTLALASLAARQDVSISARVDLSTSGQHTVGLIARRTAGGYYEARLTKGDGTVTAAIHRVGGVSPKVLKSLKFTKATAGTLQFDVEGKTLKLSLLGESITVTDAEFASPGQSGVHLGGGNSLDDFVVR